MINAETAEKNGNLCRRRLSTDIVRNKEQIKQASI